jgi:glutathione peroxidase-family protein
LSFNVSSCGLDENQDIMLSVSKAYKNSGLSLLGVPHVPQEAVGGYIKRRE